MPEATFAQINGANLYYEQAGHGKPFVMIHAGVADSRMWNHEFAYFAEHYQVLRFDMRGYGKSKPVEGDFNIQNDFEALLHERQLTQPMILMGCSIGAGLAIEYTLTHPQTVDSLILVGGSPRGFEAKAEDPTNLFEQAQAAFHANDLDRVTKLSMQIWFDGSGRLKSSADEATRQLAQAMMRLALENEAKQIGRHVRRAFDPSPVDRLSDLNLPTLAIVGENDLPSLLESTTYMEQHIPQAVKVVMPDAAHLPNLEHPELFRNTINQFLES